MKRTPHLIWCILGIVACPAPAPKPVTAPPPAPKTTAPAAPGGARALASGIAEQFIDPSVSPRDDLYRHVNGRWLARAKIPPDRARWGAFIQLRDETQKRLRKLVRATAAGADADCGKISALYRGFMNEASLEQRGSAPLRPLFAKVAAVRRRAQVPPLLAELAKIGVSVPYVPYVHQDARDSTPYVFDLYQAGLGMPDRDYYLKKDDAKLKEVREKYLRYAAGAGFVIIGLWTLLKS